MMSDDKPWIGREEQAVGHPGECGPTKPPRISADSRSSAVPPEQYPTVWAYEQACRTLETTKNEVRDLKAQLRVAEQAYGEMKIKCAYQFAKREEAEHQNEVNFAERQKMGEALERITAERRAWQSEREQMVNNYLRDQGEIERLTHLEAQACANLDAAQAEIERRGIDAQDVAEARREIEGLKFLLAWIRTGLPAMSEPAKRIDEAVPDWRERVMR